MKYALKIVPLTFSTEHDNEYIKSFDPYHPDEFNLGNGLLITTKSLKDAKMFDTPMEAMEFWKQQSPTVPLRTDGKPNRPLTAFSIEMKRVDEIVETESEGN